MVKENEVLALVRNERLEVRPDDAVPCGPVLHFELRLRCSARNSGVQGTENCERRAKRAQDAHMPASGLSTRKVAGLLGYILCMRRMAEH